MFAQRAACGLRLHKEMLHGDFRSLLELLVLKARDSNAQVRASLLSYEFDEIYDLTFATFTNCNCPSKTSLSELTILIKEICAVYAVIGREQPRDRACEVRGVL